MVRILLTRVLWLEEEEEVEVEVEVEREDPDDPENEDDAMLFDCCCLLRAACTEEVI